MKKDKKAELYQELCKEIDYRVLSSADKAYRSSVNKFFIYVQTVIGVGILVAGLSIWQNIQMKNDYKESLEMMKNDFQTQINQQVELINRMAVMLNGQEDRMVQSEKTMSQYVEDMAKITNQYTADTANLSIQIQKELSEQIQDSEKASFRFVNQIQDGLTTQIQDSENFLLGNVNQIQEELTKQLQDSEKASFHYVNQIQDGLTKYIEDLTNELNQRDEELLRAIENVSENPE